MNGIVKKISTGLLALAIAVMGVAAISGETYAADDTGPCEGATWDGNKVVMSGDVARPHECSACIGAEMANGQTKEEAAMNKCKDTRKYSVDSVWGWVYTVVNWILIAVGIICVVFIIFGGIRYATSGGDSDKVKNAKNTILYAVIGLVVAILARVIVEVVFQISNTLITP